MTKIMTKSFVHQIIIEMYRADLQISLAKIGLQIIEKISFLTNLFCCHSLLVKSRQLIFKGRAFHEREKLSTIFKIP
jgi:hypothetical protein